MERAFTLRQSGRLMFISSAVPMMVSRRRDRAGVRGLEHRVRQIGFQSGGLVADDGAAAVRTEGRAFDVERGVDEAKDAGASVVLNGRRADECLRAVVYLDAGAFAVSAGAVMDDLVAVVDGRLAIAIEADAGGRVVRDRHSTEEGYTAAVVNSDTKRTISLDRDQVR